MCEPGDGRPTHLVGGGSGVGRDYGKRLLSSGGTAHGEDIKVVSGGFHVDHPLFWSDFNGYILPYLPRNSAKVDVLHLVVDR